MKKLALKPGFALLLMEITFLCGLKPNAPDTELSGTEKRQLSNIYYKYFGSTETLSKELMSNELANKWPGNERKKTHECQRAILDTLHKLNAALIPAGPIDSNTPLPMDLSFVMGFLEGAKANEIIILTLCTDVVTEVPVVKERDEDTGLNRPANWAAYTAYVDSFTGEVDAMGYEAWSKANG